MLSTYTSVITILFCLQHHSIESATVNISTPARKEYLILDSYGIVPTSSNFIRFKLKAERDGHFGLLQNNLADSSMYEVNLGGWWNKVTCFRKMPSYTCIDQYTDNDGILNETAYVELWFSFEAGRIQYGKIEYGNLYQRWVDYTDGSAYNINHFAISSYSGVEGSWLIDSDYDNPWQLPTWSAWSECSSTCGQGYRTRSRNNVCKHFDGSVDDTRCQGSHDETLPCPLQCEDDNPWQLPTWSAWSECSSTCGQGYRTRSRNNVCKHFDGSVDNTRCQGSHDETLPCPLQCEGYVCTKTTNLTTDELETKLENIRKELKINKSELALSRRELISAPDSRQSSAYIGYSAGFLLCSFFIFILSFDFPLLVQFVESKIKRIEPSEN